jgi:predicted N-acyltransferase
LAPALKPEVRAHRRVAEIGRAAWDACAARPDYAGNPFVLYDFLDAAEAADCAVERTGWGPQHLSVHDSAGEVAAVMPLYLKAHSQGEYVFDHSWADAYQRAGGRYYPKLLSAAPFTPATGPRMLVRPGVDEDEARAILLGGTLALCERYGASSIHVNFPLDEEWRWMGEQGFGLRQGTQYHWLNRGYGTFDDFLADLSSGRRKTIRRERREAQAGLEIACLTGGDLTEAHWDAFFRFYMDTGARKWGRPYLNRRFFSLLGERMADRVLSSSAITRPSNGRSGGAWPASRPAPRASTRSPADTCRIRSARRTTSPIRPCARRSRTICSANAPRWKARWNGWPKSTRHSVRPIEAVRGDLLRHRGRERRSGR